MRTSARRAAGAAALSLALVAVACGSGTRIGFAMRARAVCNAYYNKAYALPPPVGLTQLKVYAEKQQALEEERLAGLRALQAPVGQRVTYGKYLAEDASFDRLRETAIAADFHTPHPKAFVRHYEQLQLSIGGEARALGLSVCLANPYSAKHTVRSSENAH